jgi:hypothetical protein
VANLWRPLDDADGRDFGTHGSFDDAAIRTSAQAWLVRVGLSPALVNAAAGAAAGITMIARDRREFVAALRERDN